MAERVRQLPAEAAAFRLGARAAPDAEPEKHRQWPKVLAGLRAGTTTRRETANRRAVRYQALLEALAALDADSQRSPWTSGLRLNSPPVAGAELPTDPFGTPDRAFRS